MEFNYIGEVMEFLSAETLEAIDYGVLDLSYVKDYGLKEVLYFFEDMLTFELKANYRKNETGIFRVSHKANKFFYTEFGHVIEADSLSDLKELVLAENRIWYVFDEISMEELKRMNL